MMSKGEVEEGVYLTHFRQPETDQMALDRRAIYRCINDHENVSTRMETLPGEGVHGEYIVLHCPDCFSELLKIVEVTKSRWQTLMRHYV